MCEAIGFAWLGAEPYPSTVCTGNPAPQLICHSKYVVDQSALPLHATLVTVGSELVQAVRAELPPKVQGADEVPAAAATAELALTRSARLPSGAAPAVGAFASPASSEISMITIDATK